MQDDQKDVVKEAAIFIKNHYEDQGETVQVSHAHALVSHALGYNSKKALIDDDSFFSDDENIVSNFDLDVDKVRDRLQSMKPNPLQSKDVDELMSVVRAGLAPPCECCGEKKLDITPLGDMEDDPLGWVSSECAENSDDYGTCMYCTSGTLHRLSDLNRHGECSVHDGEGELDEDEEEDIESYIEYHTKDG